MIGGMSLPDPPLWQYLLLEQPWPVMIALGVGAAVLSVAARRRRLEGRRGGLGLRVAAWAAAIAAGGVYGVASSIVTEREQLLDQTRQVVAATQSPIDVAAVLERWLGEDAALVGPGGEKWLDRSQIEQTLAGLERRRQIERHDIRGLDAGIVRAGQGRSHVELSTRLVGGPRAYGPLHSVWELEWIRDEDEQRTWRLRDVRWVSFRGQPAEHYLLSR